MENLRTHILAVLQATDDKLKTYDGSMQEETIAQYEAAFQSIRELCQNAQTEIGYVCERGV